MSRTAPPKDWKTQAQTFGQELWATTHGQARWQGLSARERLLARMFLGLIGVWLFVSIAISPALKTLSTAQQQRAEVAQQLLQMRALQQRAQELQKTKPLSRDESLRSLQSITPTGNPALQMVVQGDRVLVQLKNMTPSQLAAWLAQARSNAQALPDEAHITRSNSSGGNAAYAANAISTTSTTTTAWDGQIVLRLPQRQANNFSPSSNANVGAIKP